MKAAILAVGYLMLLLRAPAADYDRQRHDRIERVIEGDADKLLGKSLSEVAQQLDLEKVHWDKGYTNYPEGELRIYHFRGFSLTLHLQLLPKGITPTQKSYSYTNDELRRSGVWWLAAFGPFVRIDHIDDPKARMKKYWEGVSAEFAGRKRQSEARKSNTLKEAARDRAAEGELKISCEPMDQDTGTSWYQKRVTYSLEGYKPLVIEADMERGVYPTGAREIHKLGPARFLLMGGFSAGGGRYTKVAMIICAKDGRLAVQDQVKFSRDRRANGDKVFELGETLAVGFPALPREHDESTHELYDWNIVHQGESYYSDAIRRWPLTKISKTPGEWIVIKIGDNGFMLPVQPKAKAERER